MTNRQLLRYIFPAIVCLLLTLETRASPFSELIVFGDSLSDIGNVEDATLSVQPGSFYFDGRFSNGPVYAELLAESLGLGPLTASADGGTNYAHGGAQTTGTGFFAGLFIDDVDDQVDDFVAARSANADSLIVLLAGANDLFNGQRNVSVPVNQLVNDMERLISADAENFLVMNLPLLGTTPRFNRDAEQAAVMNELTNDFNELLDAELDELESSHPSVEFFRLDIAALISEGIANPADFGFTNVVDPVAPGLDSGQVFYDSSRIADNPDEYLFWDVIHPTAAAHAFLAEAALESLRTPGDFNFDWFVNADDLAQWEVDFGQSGDSDANGDGFSDGADFLRWQRTIQDAQNGPLSARVPEPATAVLTILFAVLIVRYRRQACRK